MTRYRVILPLPPSVNAAFVSARGKFLRKSAAYAFWERELAEQTRPEPAAFEGQVRVSVALPPAMRGDIDNRTKLLLDVLQPRTEKRPSGLGVILDDKQVRELTVAFRAGVGQGTCVVTVEELAACG